MEVKGKSLWTWSRAAGSKVMRLLGKILHFCAESVSLILLMTPGHTGQSEEAASILLFIGAARAFFLCRWWRWHAAIMHILRKTESCAPQFHSCLWKLLAGCIQQSLFLGFLGQSSSSPSPAELLEHPCSRLPVDSLQTGTNLMMWLF